MGELRELAISFVLMIFIATFTYWGIGWLESPPVGEYEVREYSAHLTSNGILYENYTYIIHRDGRYHMLYRIWKSPLYYVFRNETGIFLLNISLEGYHGRYLPYVKTHYPEVYVLNNISYNSDEYDYIASSAERDEAGVYVPSGFPSGRYVVRYVFLLRPFFDRGPGYYHLRLLLADKHAKYGHVDITLPNLRDVYFSPYLEKGVVEGRIHLRGVAEEDYPLLLDLFFENISSFPHGGVVYVGDILPGIRWNSLLEDYRYRVAWGIPRFLMFLMLLLPFIYLVYYVLRGRDRPCAPPMEVMEPPVRRKPIVVNYILKNEGDHIDYSSVALATLLDMNRRGIIEITPLVNDTSKMSNEYLKISFLRFVHMR